MFVWGLLKDFLKNFLLTDIFYFFFSGKKNEILQGGISSIRIAATTMAKKFDEIKQSLPISNTNTPIKTNGGSNSSTLERDRNLHSSNDDLLNDERLPGRRRVASEFDLWGSRKSSYSNLTRLGEAASTNSLNSYPTLPDNVYGADSGAQDGDIKIQITSCSQCHQCSVLIYDEEIMAGWTGKKFIFNFFNFN